MLRKQMDYNRVHNILLAVIWTSEYVFAFYIYKYVKFSNKATVWYFHRSIDIAITFKFFKFKSVLDVLYFVIVKVISVMMKNKLLHLRKKKKNNWILSAIWTGQQTSLLLFCLYKLFKDVCIFFIYMKIHATYFHILLPFLRKN